VPARARPTDSVEPVARLRAQLPADLLGLRLAVALEHERELVAADAERAAASRSRGAQQRGHRAQHVVARRMAAGVVDRLEAVDVGEQHHRAAAAAGGLAHGRGGRDGALQPPAAGRGDVQRRGRGLGGGRPRLGGAAEQPALAEVRLGLAQYGQLLRPP
jgi:hypothetical protein